MIGTNTANHMVEKHTLPAILEFIIDLSEIFLLEIGVKPNHINSTGGGGKECVCVCERERERERVYECVVLVGAGVWVCGCH